MPGMTDRDTFAAAALTGLLAQGDDGSFSEESYVRGAYRWADAMLRERERKNLDAAPAARAPEPEPEPAARRRPAGGTGGTDHGASPEARARTDADRGRTDKADFRPGKGTGDTQEPVAWGVAGSNGLLYATSVSRMDAVDMQSEHECDTHVVPLYRQPTLTDAEREAIYRASQYLSQNDVFEGMAEDAATLRGLLERMK